jgi:hypothetical protein
MAISRSLEADWQRFSLLSQAALASAGGFAAASAGGEHRSTEGLHTFCIVSERGVRVEGHMTWHQVDVKEDHLNSLIGRPLKGIEELVWNALDADATEIRIEIGLNAVGGVQEVRVLDDGTGMTPRGAIEAFQHLGGSWKSRTDRSPGNRPLHGKAGQGRWRAFGIGNSVRWETVAAVDGVRYLTTIRGSRQRPDGFEISDPVETDRAQGTSVIIDSFSEPPPGLLGETVPTKLTTSLALALAAFDVIITYDGSTLDASALQEHKQDYEIELPDRPEDAVLTVIEWNIPVERSLYLCDANGATLHEIRPQIQAPGFEFTAYLKWAGFAANVHNLALAELGDEELSDPIERAKDRLRDHFRDRSSEATKRLIEGWKAEEAYPFQGEPQSRVERAERQVFDMVALAASKAVNSSSDKKARRLSLNLLKVAIENDPGGLQEVLGHVIDLPADRVEELRQILTQTSLTSLITAAKTVTNRLSFIRALEILVFDPETKGKVKERSQLHRILANETWIFGEEYALTADDESLNTALTRHLKILGRERMADDEEVLDEDGKRRIVDLMLARSVEQSRNCREHLVLELKAPSVKAGADELTQIENYAFTVAADARFDKVDVQWDFVLVTAELTDFAENRRNQSDREGGLLVVQDRLRVWVKTWAEVLQSAEHRMKFVQQALDVDPSTEDALKYLNDTHEKYLPDNLKA